MNNKTLTIGAAALTAVIVTTGFALSTFASQGNSSIAAENNVPEVEVVNTVEAKPAFQHGGEGCAMAKGGTHGDSHCAGRKGSSVKGQNTGGNFIDANGDGVCDKMQ